MKRIISLFFFATLGAALAPAWGQDEGEEEEGRSPFVSARGKGKAEDAPSPMQLIGTNTVQLGKVSGLDIKHVTFVFTNAGPTQVRLTSLRPTCSCVRGESDKSVIPPGGTVVVTFHFTPYNIHGSFQRGLWVSFSGTTLKRFHLAVSGEVLPLFEGLPSEPISLQSAEMGVVWTNRYVVTPTESGIRLDTPKVGIDENVRVEACLAAVPATNTAGAASYELTLVVRPLTVGRHKTQVTLPVTGRPDLPAITLDLSVHAGLSMTAKPDQVKLYASETPVVRRILVRTDDPDAAEESLTWGPAIEGLTVSVKKIKAKSTFMVTLEFTPAAVKRLRAGKESRLLFRYPRHEPVEVLLTPANGLNGRSAEG